MPKKSSLCCVLTVLHLLSTLAKMTDFDFEFGSDLNHFGEVSYQEVGLHFSTTHPT
jgi:hypothetical protein